jgi:hypothetical protein
MKTLLLTLFLISPILGVSQNQYVNQIKSIIQNDTTYESVAFVYEYELENGDIKHPDSITYHLDDELLNIIPGYWPNQIVFFTEPWVCDQVRLPSGEIVDKHEVTYSPAHGEYELCFFVIELSPELIEINYSIRTGRHWW